MTGLVYYIVSQCTNERYNYQHCLLLPSGIPTAIKIWRKKKILPGKKYCFLHDPFHKILCKAYKTWLSYSHYFLRDCINAVSSYSLWYWSSSQSSGRFSSTAFAPVQPTPRPWVLPVSSPLFCASALPPESRVNRSSSWKRMNE